MSTARNIRVKRELEDGWFQHITMPLPAVLTIQSGINKLRYATLMGIKKAKSKEIKRVTAAELGGAPVSTAVIEKIYVPHKTQTNADFRRRREIVGRQAGREIEIRGAGHMSVLVVLEQQGGKWHRMSPETLAAGQQFGASSEPAGGSRGARCSPALAETRQPKSSPKSIASSTIC